MKKTIFDKFLHPKFSNVESIVASDIFYDIMYGERIFASYIKLGGVNMEKRIEMLERENNKLREEKRNLEEMLKSIKRYLEKKEDSNLSIHLSA